MGEVIHGDYRRWANPGMLDSVTNYECYKGLYSSHVDQNYFEIAYALNRQYGAEGIYRDLLLYNFADNHDVNRVASNLTNAAHLYPLQILLFSIPGVPSIYYGSEWGLAGMKTPHSDAPLRPAIDLGKIALNAPAPDLPAAIARLARIRQQSPALQRGDYTQLHVAHQQLAFTRQVQGERVVVAVNAAETTVSLNLTLPEGCGTALVDLLNPGERFDILNGQCTVSLPACWGRIFICAE
jgi:glycosidase